MAEAFWREQLSDGTPVWVGKDLDDPGVMGSGPTYEEAWRDLQSAKEDVVFFAEPLRTRRIRLRIARREKGELRPECV
jgi:hypothetical protein